MQITLKCPEGQVWTIMGTEKIPSERQMNHRAALEHLKLMGFLPMCNENKWYENFYCPNFYWDE